LYHKDINTIFGLSNQCALPVFDDLFSQEVQPSINNLLYTMAYWHSLAKLDLHTESTLDALTKATTRLGSELRRFANVTSQRFDTKETPTEQRKRLRRRAAENISGGTITARLSQSFKLDTSKIHALGDYVDHIKRFGPSGMISTQAVSNTSGAYN
jgi:hypothetical protein